MTEQSIVIVDDNLDLAENLKELLERDEVCVHLASNGPDALRLIERHQPRLVVTDMRMPGMNGVEVLKAIRASWPEIPVILITAYAQDHLLDEAREAGVLAVLAKPLDLDQLAQVIARVVDSAVSILLVEDSPDLRVNMAEALQEIDGVRVYSAASVAEALHLHRRAAFHLAVIDQCLPDGDGLGLARMLRAGHEGAALPVVFVNGYPDDLLTSLERSEEHSDRVLIKPIPAESLLSTVRNLL